MDFHPFALGSLFVGFLLLMSAVYATTRHPSGQSNRLYFFFALIGIWCFFAKSMFWSARDPATAAFWTAMVKIWPFLIPLGVRCALMLSRPEKQYPLWLSPVLYLPALFFMIADFMIERMSASPVLRLWGDAFAFSAHSWLIAGRNIWIAVLSTGTLLHLAAGVRSGRDRRERTRAGMIAVAVFFPSAAFISNLLLPRLNFLFPGTLSLGLGLAALWLVVTGGKTRLFEPRLSTLADDLWELTPDLFIIVDAEQRIARVNAVARQLLSPRDGELVGKRLGEIFEGGPVEILTKMEIDQLELVCVTDRGRRIPVLFSSKMIYSADGRVSGILLAGKDISLQKIVQKSKHDLETSAIRAAAFEAVGIGILLIDEFRQILTANSAFEKMTGTVRGILIERRIDDCAKDPAFPESVRRLFQGVSIPVPEEGNSGGALIRSEERQILRTINSIRQSGEAMELTVVLYRDVTEDINARDALRAEKAILNVTLHNIREAVLAIDGERNVLVSNRTAAEWTGLPHNEIRGKNLDALVMLEDPDGVPLSRSVLKGAAPAEINALLTTSYLAKKPVSLAVSPLGGVEGPLGTVIVIRDLSVQQRREAEKLRTQKLESLGILAGGLAHDFNNLLTTIIGNLSLLRIMFKDRVDAREILKDMDSASQEAKGLSHQLLTFAKGGAPIKKLLDAGTLLRETISFSLSGSRIQPRYRFSPALWPIEADETQIRQVINNLVINAVEAMPDGGVLRVYAVNINRSTGRPGPDGHLVKIMIRDEGVGISDENISRIFDPYFSTKNRGGGLGLATVYSIITRHGGTIDVKSLPGRGTGFIIHLPAFPGANPVITEDDEQPVFGQGRVLLMDDEPSVRDTAGRMLSFLGYEPLAVSNGEEVIDRYRGAVAENRPFDAVILDLTIPGGMGGVAVLSELLKIDPRVMAVVASGYSLEPVMAVYGKSGFKAALAKPYKMGELSRIMSGLFNLQDGQVLPDQARNAE